MKIQEKFLLAVKNNKLIGGSIVMVVGSFLGSFTNYLYHLSMARALGPKDYGVLESMISIVYQLAIPLATITLVITKYVASFKGQNNHKKIESFFWKISKKLIIITPVIFLVLLFAIPFIAKFLKLSSSSLFLWIILSFCLTIFTTLGKSFMQGLSRFFLLSLSGFLDGFFRLTAAIIMVAIGWHLFGAVFSFFVAAIFSFFVTMYFIKDIIFGAKSEPIKEKKEIFKFIFPVFFTNLGITSFITSDVILARHFLSPVDAGIYSALSTLGKIIFFVATPVISVIYPTISESHAAKKEINKEALFGLLIIALLVFGSLLIFGLFPKLMVNLLFGKNYLQMVPFVLIFGIAMSIYTINTALLNIFLALKITFPTVLVVIAAALQIILIILFHNSISAIINIFIVLSALLLIILLIYYRYVQKKIALRNSTNL